MAAESPLRSTRIRFAGQPSRVCDFLTVFANVGNAVRSPCKQAIFVKPPNTFGSLLTYSYLCKRKNNEIAVAQFVHQ